MIIRFTVENWMSFREPATLNMIATREKQHRSRLPRLLKYGISVLPIAALYGGNASGKSNFFKALEFVKQFVIKGSQIDAPIPMQPFLLDPECADKPSRFNLEMLIDETIYEFAFAVTGEYVVEESLTRILGSDEELLYRRRDGDIKAGLGIGEIDMEGGFFSFVARATRGNQLFLTHAVSQNVEELRPVYHWFQHGAKTISPSAHFANLDTLCDPHSPLHEPAVDLLRNLDTGIQNLASQEIPLSDASIEEVFREGLKKGGGDFGHRALIESIRETPLAQGAFTATLENERVVVKRLLTEHAMFDGTIIPFDMTQESDGSQRLVHLIPAFLKLGDMQSKLALVIDELDRSLHTLATQNLIAAYLESCTPESRSQLIFTTHDLLLMDQDFLRRDEMWVTERDEDGGSTLYSFSDFKDIRKDKDIRKSYLQGRLGGVPRLLVDYALSHRVNEAIAEERSE